MSTELAIREDQAAFDAKQLSALEHLGVASASRADQAIFFHQCVRTGLDPFARQIYMIERQGKQTIQTGIDGFRLVARRAADRNGETLGYAKPLWCGEDGVWRDVWLGGRGVLPSAAQFTVYRDGQPFTATALMGEFLQTKRDGSAMAQWAVKPAHMLAKCAEALALRMAFPQDLSGLYTNDEMGIGAEVRERRTARIRPLDQAGLPPGEIEGTGITEAQRVKIMACYGDLDLGGDDCRDDRLADTSAVVGRDVTSTNDLSKAEAHQLIESLEARVQRVRDEAGQGAE